LSGDHQDWQEIDVATTSYLGLGPSVKLLG